MLSFSSHGYQSIPARKPNREDSEKSSLLPQFRVFSAMIASVLLLSVAGFAAHSSRGAAKHAAPVAAAVTTKKHSSSEWICATHANAEGALPVTGQVVGQVLVAAKMEVSFRLKKTGYVSGGHSILLVGDNKYTACPKVFLNDDATKNLVFFHSKEKSSEQGVSAEVEDDVWYDVKWTIDDSTMALYLDGELQDSVVPDSGKRWESDVVAVQYAGVTSRGACENAILQDISVCAYVPSPTVSPTSSPVPPTLAAPSSAPSLAKPTGAPTAAPTLGSGWQCQSWQNAEEEGPRDSWEVMRTGLSRRVRVSFKLRQTGAVGTCWLLHVGDGKYVRRPGFLLRDDKQQNLRVRVGVSKSITEGLDLRVEQGVWYDVLWESDGPSQSLTVVDAETGQRQQAQGTGSESSVFTAFEDELQVLYGPSEYGDLCDGAVVKDFAICNYEE